MNAHTSKSKLRGIAPTSAAPVKPKFLIFGKPGVGKTWTALDFPSVFYIDTEGGASLPHYTAKLAASGGAYFGQAEGALDFEAVLGQVQALATETHPFRTLVIDSVSKLFNTAIALEAERLGSKNAFGADKKPAVAGMRRLVSWLNRLDMNVALIAHEKVEWGMVNGERSEVGATYDGWDKLGFELDAVFQVTKEGGSRYLIVRKSRLIGFPDGDRVPWVYDTFAERYGREVIEGRVEPITLTDAATVTEIERLVTLLSFEEWQDKILAKANAGTLAELTADQGDKALAYLNEKVGK